MTIRLIREDLTLEDVITMMLDAESGYTRQAGFGIYVKIVPDLTPSYRKALITVRDHNMGGRVSFSDHSKWFSDPKDAVTWFNLMHREYDRYC